MNQSKFFRMIDVGSQWRTFANDKDKKDMNRVGAAENPMFGSDNLETVMSMGTGAGAVDEFGKQRYNNGPRQVLSLVSFFSLANFPFQLSSADKALRSGHDAIRQMAGRINLSSRIINRAFLLFKQCYENKCVRGRSQDAIVATCIYIACRQEGAQRTIKGKEKRCSRPRWRYSDVLIRNLCHINKCIKERYRSMF